MFIRKTPKKDPATGKRYFTFQLVESVRTERGPRQRILLNLGPELNLSDEDRKLLANRIEERLVGGESLFGYPPHIEQLAEALTKQLVRKGAEMSPKVSPQTATDYRSVDLNSVKHEQSRTVGVEHIAYETLKKLGLEQKLLQLGFTKRQVAIAIGVIVGKLACPGSERATFAWMQHQSAIDELLDTDFSRLSLDSVYKVGDHLLKHRETLEEHLASTEKTLFSLNDAIVLYDLTNTYFEGTAKEIPHAARGHSKERRTDCPLVTLGLVLNKEGFPICSKVLPGNVSEPSTLQEAISCPSYSTEHRPIIVLDAGIATEENLSYLRQSGYCYLVASRRRSCEFPEDLRLEVVQETRTNSVVAGQINKTALGETHLYCLSTQRQEKEKAMRSLLQTRFEEDLQKAAEALGKKGGMKSYPKVVERIGRLKEKHKRIASYYEIDVKANETGTRAVEITWQINEQKLKNRFQGGYFLRVYGLDWSSEDLWKTYIMLTEVEEAFRCLKSELGLRPVYHQIGTRVDAHLFITLLAYHIMQTILYELRMAGISLCWETLRRRMSTQTRVTTTMRLETGKSAHIRASTSPENFHREIYRVLNLPHQPGRRIKTII